MIVTNKSLVPDRYYPLLDDLLSKSQKEVKLMLKNRSQNSSKYYKSIPSKIANGLICKYQKNKKCKSVKRCVLPIFGEKGKIIKLEPNNHIRITTITKKETFRIYPLKEIVGNILSCEFSKRKGKWYVFYTYNTPEGHIELKGFIGVDRNARDNVATIADIESGKVMRLGPDVKLWKDNIKKRKAKLQKKGVKRLLVKIKNKQSNRTKDINHKVSKQIVNYAVTHCKAIVLEDLGKIKDSKKCGKYVQKSNWSFNQLKEYISYKASLRGVPVIYVNPQNTSKGCSRCGKINDVQGKKFKCDCGHKDHRDANASFNIGIRGKQSCGGIPDNARELSVRCIDAPYTGKELFCYAR